jgi:hypothetical protein
MHFFYEKEAVPEDIQISSFDKTDTGTSSDRKLWDITGCAEQATHIIAEPKRVEQTVTLRQRQ